MIKLVDLTVAIYRDLLKQSVAGVLIIVPEEFSELSETTKEEIQALEQVMLEEATTVPVYFVVENAEVREMYRKVKKNADALRPGASGLESENYYGFR